MRMFILTWLVFIVVLIVPSVAQNDIKTDEYTIKKLIQAGKVPFPPPPFLFPPRLLKSTKIRPALQACETYAQPALDVRIIGGEEADSEEFPWMAALGYLKDTYEVSFECGGTIISEYFVITAAHCTPSIRPPVVARLGKITLTDGDGVKPDNHPIASIIKHSKYSMLTKKNDIALLKVAKRIYFSYDIAPACLQTDLNDVNSDKPLLVTGWGKTSADRGDRSNILLKTQVKTMQLTECSQLYLEQNKASNLAALRDGITPGQYCAYDPQGRNDSCQGDSGGPLQYFPNSNTTTATVVGIVSFGFGCGTELPGIYTRIAYYVDWIESVVWPNHIYFSTSIQNEDKSKNLRQISSIFYQVFAMKSWTVLLFYFFSVVSASNLIENDAKSIRELIKLGKVPFPPPPYPFPPPYSPHYRPMNSGDPHQEPMNPNAPHEEPMNFGEHHESAEAMKNETTSKPDVFIFPENSQEDTQIIDETPTLRPAERACETYLKLPINRILGGSPAEMGEFPWMAALGFLNENYQVTFDCGGTIISDYFILSAAHCCSSTRPPVVVRLGKITLTDADGVRPENHPIRDIIKHSSYSSLTKKNDIALLRVAKRIYFSDDIVPACLATDLNDVSPDLKLIVTGWGKTTAERGERSNILLKTQLKTVPLTECNRIFLELNEFVNQAALRDGITPGQYCAFDPAGKNDSCQGDSGGPLQYFPTKDSAISTVLGVVSFGYSCGTELPGVYTRVAYYLDWIESVVWSNPQ
ncbi:uncharacterized protein LOC116346717 [Contarinia nasturtii]|uniref:uncharacterized protein LOC116346717 n=1 Tax=Contarinia nasturtii TaxID=265458 RepID=UPI0012D407E7|nr:uncharacterized protein LOC116346717 [Contarinia nasturtii]